MKYCLMLLLLLSFGLSVGCAAETSGSTTTSVGLETPSITLTSAPREDAATVTPAPTFTPTPTSTSLPALTSTSTPIITPTPSPSASFTPANTPTLAPTSTSLPIPSATPTPAQPPTLAPAAVPPAADSASTSAQVERGFEIYKQQYCGLCHQLDAAATAGQFGPTHNGIGTRAEQRIHEAHYNGVATTAAAYLHESIVSPKVYVVAEYENTQHQMPAYVHLSEADIDALVQMLLQQK